ncbi:unnamed protein product [Schistocephalus solidus]|uniref:Uncharacterized protein n=1 Tax=Schistocephalus solidus TaxID=70667 RepID=A0A3P7D1E9_SCHSO|nr:unnamed protein product [Schistocephalus solidus]
MFESDYGDRVGMPEILKRYKGKNLGVYAVCIAKDTSQYKTKLLIDGKTSPNSGFPIIPFAELLGAKASIEDYEVVYQGMKIDCQEEARSAIQSFWLYISGVPQTTLGRYLKITKTRFGSSRTPITSYACCSTGTGARRRVYTYFVASEFTQAITPAKRFYNPGDVITCHIYVSTLVDVNMAREALQGVGIRITTVLLDNSIQVLERLHITSLPLPDYHKGVKQYRIQCLLDGLQRTRETVANAHCKDFLCSVCF